MDEWLQSQIDKLKAYQQVLLENGILRLEAIGDGDGDEGCIRGFAVLTQKDLDEGIVEVSQEEYHNVELLEEIPDGNTIRNIFESLDTQEYDGNGAQTKLVYDVKLNKVTISEAYYQIVLGEFSDTEY